MPKLRTLLLATFSGRLVYALANLVMLPWFASLFGAESVGLLTFFTTMLLVLMVLEGGLTSAVIRELAAIGGRCDAPRRQLEALSYSTANSYLLAFTVVGLLVAAGVVVFATDIATKWLAFDILGLSEVITCVVMMGLFIGLNFPVMILQAILTGREQQVSLNILFIGYSLSRTLGVLSVSHFLNDERSVQDFFGLQVGVQLIYIAMLLFVTYRGVRFTVWLSAPRWSLLRKGYRFGFGVFLISLTSALIVQSDKIYLSTFLPLEQYAAYGLASTFSTIPYMFSSALNAVLYPKFSAYISKSEHELVARLFKSSFSGLTLLLVFSCASAWFFAEFPIHVLFEEKVAHGVAAVFPILLIATSLQALLVIPFALQLAAGMTAPALHINLVAMPLLFAAIPVAAESYGASGVAWTWVLYNICSFVATFVILSARFNFIVPLVSKTVRLVWASLFVLLPLFFVIKFWLLPPQVGIVEVALLMAALLAMMVVCGAASHKHWR